MELPPLQRYQADYQDADAFSDLQHLLLMQPEAGNLIQDTSGSRTRREEKDMKRGIFAELQEGIEALAEERQGKVTLRPHRLVLPELRAVTGQELVSIREQLKMSRPVFAI